MTDRLETTVLSHFTLDRHHPFDERVAAASGAGLRSIGLYIGHYQQLAERGSWADEVLSAHEVAVREIEVVSAWATPDADDRGFEASAWEMADRWGCRYLQAIGPHAGTRSDAGRAFAALCDRAADHGLVVGLEFLPFTNIPDAHAAWEIVERAGRENGGVCVDIWHHRRGANDLAQILAIPADRILGVQINDGPAAPELPDYKDDCLRRRVAPGLGEFGVDEFVRALIDHGVAVPFALEVCDERLRGAGAAAAAAHVRACVEGLRETLARC